MTHFIAKFVLLQWLSGKESTRQCRRCKRWGSSPLVGEIPWRRKWQPTPVLLPGEFHGQRSLMGYSPWSRKELDRTESLSMHSLEAHFQYLWGVSVFKNHACTSVPPTPVQHIWLFLFHFNKPFLKDTEKPDSHYLQYVCSFALLLLWPQQLPPRQTAIVNFQEILDFYLF